MGRCFLGQEKEMALHSAYPLYWNNYKIQTVKLSKAQQEVVDKMREGWRLTRDDFWWWSMHDKLKPAIVKSTTIHKLVEYGVLELVEKSILLKHEEYRLTEQYKTKHK